MYMKFPQGKEKAVTLSYDDGTIFDRKLIRIMSRHGLKGTFNINSGWYSPESLAYEDSSKPQNIRLKLSEAKALYTDSGHEIAVHGLHHASWPRISDQEILFDVIEDRKSIEQEYGVIARGAAYPFGACDDRVMSILKSCGICYCRGTKATQRFELPKQWLNWEPTCHHGHPDLMKLAHKFMEEQLWEQAQLFYLWGHSYEFADDQWGIIEEFADYMGNRENVWYATNIEIYDYVQAYEQLQFSWDIQRIHNPSAMDVWVGLEGQTVRIKAGETVDRK